MKQIDESTLKAMQNVVDYMHADEQKSYEEMQGDYSPEGIERSANHIYNSVEQMRRFLASPLVDNVPSVRIEQMDSPRSGRAVANQFIVYTDAGTFFQSYRSIIAFKPRGGGKVVLDAQYWDYSTTTGRYRNEFLGEAIEETRRKIKAGEYVLADLNK